MNKQFIKISELDLKFKEAQILSRIVEFFFIFYIDPEGAKDRIKQLPPEQRQYLKECFDKFTKNLSL